MSWAWALLPPAVAAVLIRIDGLWIGPYWSFTEVVSGLGGVDARLFYELRRVRWAMARRAAYAVAMTVVVSIVRPQTSIQDALLLGAILTGLLYWPIVFHGLPLGVAKSDWLLVPAYAGAALFFISSSAIGWWGVAYARAEGAGSILDYVRAHALEGVFWSVLAIIGSAFFWGAREGLRKVVDRRRDANYERD